MGAVASCSQSHHDQARASCAIIGGRGRSAAISSTLERVHTETDQAYTEQDAWSGTNADLRWRLHSHSRLVRFACPKAGPPARPIARRHCVERQAHLRVFPAGDLPAAQRNSLASSVFPESPSPLTGGRLCGIRGINRVQCSANAMLDSSLQHFGIASQHDPLTNRWFEPR